MGEGVVLGTFGHNFENSSFSQTMFNNNGIGAGVDQVTNIFSSKNISFYTEGTASFRFKTNSLYMPEPKKLQRENLYP